MPKKRRRIRNRKPIKRRKQRRPKPSFPVVKTNYPPGTLIHSEIIPIELTNDNDGRQKAFGVARSRRQRYERYLRNLGYSRQPFGQKVDVVVTRILGPGQVRWDPSSILRGNHKEIEDSLVWLGWWHDDDAKYIGRILGDQDATNRELGPAIRIDVYAAGAIQVVCSGVVEP